MHQRLFRPDPGLPAAAYTTYEVAAPLPTHWRPATCAEVECRAHLHGWRTILDPADPDNAARLDYIRAASGRRFREFRDERGLVVFEFEPGQRCFASAEHRLPLERDPIFLRRGGDWRGNPTGEMYRHERAEDWVDDFATHQERINDTKERG